MNVDVNVMCHALVVVIRRRDALINFSTTKYSRACRMDLPGPTASVGTRTDYSVGPWDYSTCAARHLLVCSTRTTEEKYSDRKLYKSSTV
jgi:hypothetical protein